MGPVVRSYEETPSLALRQMIAPFDLERSGSSLQTSWLDAHNQVDDYSGTLGGVRKTKEQKVIKLLHCVSSSF